MKHSVLKRVLAMALCVVMLGSLLTVSVSASEAAPLVGLEIALPLAEEIPAEETPAEEAPAEETPAEETPAEETPARDSETVDEVVSETVDGGTSSDTGSDSDIEISEENFPDANLREVISGQFDGDGNGWLSEEEIAAATFFDGSYTGIADLTGLEYLTELAFIYLSGNDFTTLNASQLPKLEYLACDSCTNLITLILDGCENLNAIDCQLTAISELDLSECPNLEWLSCYGTGITELNLTDCLALAEAAGTTPTIDEDGVAGYVGGAGYLYCDADVILICPEAGLPDPSIALLIDSDFFPDEIFRTYLHENCDSDDDGYLTTEEQEAVTYIDFTYHTDYTEIETLKGIEYFTNLSSLYCNNIGIDTLDLSSNTELYRVECQNNGLTELNLTGLSNLRYLDCEGNRLTELDISYCTNLKELKCSSNHDLAELDVSNNNNIKNAVEYGLEQTADGFRSFCQENDYYGDNLLWIDSDVGIIGAVAAVSGVYIDDNSFPDFYFQDKVLNLYDTDPSNGWLSAKEIAEVTAMELNGWIADTTGIEYFTALTSVSGYNAQYTSLDLSANTELTSVYIQDCASLTALNIAGLEKLEQLTVMGAPVEELDVSGLTALKELSCTGNYYIGDMEASLQRLNASGCTALETVIAEANELTSIDLTGCTALKELDVSGNQLGSLDVSDCTALEILDCGYAGLSAIDVSMLPNLRELDCGRNYEIKELDISNCTQLEELHCDELKLTELELSGYSALEYLYCNDNAIEKLDLTGCTALRYTFVNNNAFRTLDIGDCPNLVYAVENGEIDGSSGDVSSDIHFTAKTDAGNVRFTLDEEVTIVGADMPAGRLISAYHFPDSGFRSAVADALGVSEYEFAYEEDFLNCTTLGDSGMYSDTKDLTGLEYFPNLTTLYVQYTEVEEIDLSLVPELTKLVITASPVESLDLSYVPNLTGLYIAFTDITELNLSHVPGLTYLDCSGTLIMELDLTENESFLQSLVGIEPQTQGYALEDGTAMNCLEYYNENGELILACHEDTVITPAIPEEDEGGDDTGNEGGDDTGSGSVDYDTTEDLSGIDQTASIPLTREYFPDSAFLDYVTAYDENGDGALSPEERNAVSYIECCGWNITTLRGVEYFPELMELWCDDNGLTYLNVTANTKLMILSCSHNRLTGLNMTGLTELDLLQCGGNSALTTLDISTNTDLEEISIYGCAVTALDISICPKLRYLNASNNKLTALDISKNDELFILYVQNNNLTSLDLTGHEDMRYLGIGGNSIPMPALSELPELRYLDCENMGLSDIALECVPELEVLYCGGNNLTELDLSLVPALEELNCFGNNLTALDVSVVPGLTSLWCEGNSIDKLDISSNTLLSYIYNDGSCNEYETYRFYSLSYAYGYLWLSVDSDTVVTAAPKETSEGVAVTAENFPDSVFLEYVAAWFDSDSSGYLSGVEIAFATSLDVGYSDITDLTGIEYLTALEELWSYGLPITELDLSKNTALKELYCMGTQITELDLSANTKLEYLVIDESPIETLVLGDMPALVELSAYGCALTALDITGCPALKQLMICENNLEVLDLTGCPILADTVRYGEDYSDEDYIYCYTVSETNPDSFETLVNADSDLALVLPMPDLTDDGVMDEEDVEVILNYIVLADTVLAENPELQAVADVNGDGSVDARDATQILRYANGLSSVME